MQGIRPPIWRRILISSTTKLDEFHEIIQIVMGWYNCHLHQFITQNARYGMKDDEIVDWAEEFQGPEHFELEEINKLLKEE